MDKNAENTHPQHHLHLTSVKKVRVFVENRALKIFRKSSPNAGPRCRPGTKENVEATTRAHGIAFSTNRGLTQYRSISTIPIPSLAGVV